MAWDIFRGDVRTWEKLFHHAIDFVLTTSVGVNRASPPTFRAWGRPFPKRLVNALNHATDAVPTRFCAEKVAVIMKVMRPDDSNRLKKN